MSQQPTFKVAALFAGIGGIERGLHEALGQELQTELFCEWWAPAQQVLRRRFPDVEVHPDVREFSSFSADVNLVTAGFPCTDLSQAGRTKGIDGENSGLVRHLFAALRNTEREGHLPSLMIENVPNMLNLERGRAMQYLVDELTALGYLWAYRVVDSRFSGVPQRRRRVILLASTEFDPREVLFSDDAGPRSDADFREDAFGFYWTEGRGGLGWAQDATPTLKGGSNLGIPSPPALWVPGNDEGRRLVKPLIEDAEALQGFPRGWTDVFDASDRSANRARWKLVGNAVTVGVAGWVGKRLLDPGDGRGTTDAVEWEFRQGGWPAAAWGYGSRKYQVRGVSEFPEHRPYEHLASVVQTDRADPLSRRATAGFLSRLNAGNLGRHPGFRAAVADHLQFMEAA